MKERNYSLDALKLIATILIVFHHYQQTTGAFFEKINFYGGSFYFGYIVELFFVLSGYFMYRYIKIIQDGKESFISFYIKRASRLLPLVAITAIAHEVMLYVYNALVGHLWFNTYNIDLWGTIVTCLGVQEGWGIPNPFVNNPTWYISVLLICYIVFYFITWLSARVGVKEVVLYIGMLFIAMGIGSYGINLPFLNGTVARGYLGFFCGVLLAMLLNRVKIGKGLIIFSLISIVLITYCNSYAPYVISNGFSNLLTFIYYPSIIIIFNTKLFKTIFSHKIWGELGKISYNMFVWHGPLFIVMYLLIEKLSLSWNLNSEKAMVLCTLAIGIWSAFSHYFVEVPIDKYIKSKLRNLK